MGNLQPLMTGILIMGKPPLLGWWAYPLLYGNIVSLDPSTYDTVYLFPRPKETSLKIPKNMVSWDTLKMLLFLGPQAINFTGSEVIVRGIICLNHLNPLQLESNKTPVVCRTHLINWTVWWMLQDVKKKQSGSTIWVSKSWIRKTIIQL